MNTNATLERFESERFHHRSETVEAQATDAGDVNHKKADELTGSPLETRLERLEAIYCRCCLEKPIPLRTLSRQPLPSGMAIPVTVARTQLHELKSRMLRSALELATDVQLYQPLCGAAHEAAALAWQTAYPLLVFPCLFQELADAICARASAKIAA